MTASPPTVIFIDDHIEQLTPLGDLVGAKGAQNCRVYSPADIDEQLLGEADLVVVDFSLTDWIEHEPVEQLSLKPIDGIALAAVLRQHCKTFHRASPTGFVLITGHIGSLGPLPDEQRSHVISRLNNLEWFFDKSDDAQKNADQILSLARAISDLPTFTEQEFGKMDVLMGYLHGGEHELSGRFREAVQKCRPPIHHLAESSHGLVILRWLLHNILPHTAFLMSQLTLAARLGVNSQWLETQLENDSPLEHLLHTQRYTGALAEFDGTRWWRDGVEQLLWDITEGVSSNDEAVHAALVRVGVDPPEPLGLSRPVVTLDHEFKVEPELSATRDVVPLRLDDWPSYAEPAYIRKSELEAHPEMHMYSAIN